MPCVSKRRSQLLQPATTGQFAVSSSRVFRGFTLGLDRIGTALYGSPSRLRIGLDYPEILTGVFVVRSFGRELLVRFGLDWIDRTSSKRFYPCRFCGTIVGLSDYVVNVLRCGDECSLIIGRGAEFLGISLVGIVLARLCTRRHAVGVILNLYTTFLMPI